jgi:site-specific DNA-methyltransferase (adenine-specific)
MPESIALNIDCMEYMKTVPDKHFALAIVDPPYGIDFSNYSDRIPNIKKGITAKKLYEKKDWDTERPPKEYFAELLRVSKEQIVCGGNYFADLLPASRGWIYWDKKVTNANNKTFSDGEIIWTSFDRRLQKVTYDWIGFGYLNNPAQEKKIHQTQKPLFLYDWLLTNYAETGWNILDTHLGSGSSRIACHKAGYDFVGCEIDKDYFDAQEKRFADYLKQIPMEFKPTESQL